MPSPVQIALQEQWILPALQLSIPQQGLVTGLTSECLAIWQCWNRC